MDRTVNVEAVAAVVANTAAGEGPEVTAAIVVTIEAVVAVVATTMATIEEAVAEAE